MYIGEIACSSLIVSHHVNSSEDTRSLRARELNINTENITPERKFEQCIEYTEILFVPTYKICMKNN